MPIVPTCHTIAPSESGRSALLLRLPPALSARKFRSNGLFDLYIGWA
jgi:hypothetical protein